MNAVSQNARLGLILYGLMSNATVFAAADAVYDFGVQSTTPKVTSTNPALLSHCESQTQTGLTSRDIAFELEGEVLRTGASSNKGSQSGSLDFGMCQRLLRWLSYGIHVNANTLSFRFETQNQSDPVVFPYGKSSLPIGSGGIGIKLTERFSTGFAWKLVEKVNVRAHVPVESLALQANIDVEVRPVFSWLLGTSYQMAGYEFYYSYAPELSGDLDFAFDVDIDLPLIQYDIDVVALNTAIAYTPAQNRVGVLTQKWGISVDLGLVQSQWSKMNDPFLDVQAFGDLDSLLFPRTVLQLNDTLEPYLVIEKDVTSHDRLQVGYAYRTNPIEHNTSRALIGADLHSVKLGWIRRMSVFNENIQIGGQLVFGFMDGQQGDNARRLSGHYSHLQLNLMVPLDD